MGWVLMLSRLFVSQSSGVDTVSRQGPVVKNQDFQEIQFGLKLKMPTIT